MDLTKLIKRTAARMLHETGPVCFYCGTRRATPCPGHESGGVITQWRSRSRWIPAWLLGRIDCRWTLLDINKRTR